jgi:hypothetical protein
MVVFDLVVAVVLVGWLGSSTARDSFGARVSGWMTTRSSFPFPRRCPVTGKQASPYIPSWLPRERPLRWKSAR